MTKELPPSRTEHVGRQLSAAHHEYDWSMRAFLADLGRAEKWQVENIAELRAKLGVAAEYSETRDIERFSLAVQVFAAIAIESAISFYAVLRFGGEHHDDHFRWPPAVERLRKALPGVEENGTVVAELCELVERVMKNRHRIMHPVVPEYSGPDVPTLQQPDRPFPNTSAAAAREAAAEVDRFYSLMRDADPAHAHFFVRV